MRPGSVLLLALAAGALSGTGSGPQAANARALRLTGTVEVSGVDDDGDGLLEAARISVQLEVLTPGEYTLNATLEKSGRAVAHRPSCGSVLSSHATLTGTPGIHRASFAFSGEEIFQSGEDGPYDLTLVALGPRGAEVLKSATPFLDRRRFGEIGAAIAAAGETASDEDGDGRLDTIRVTADVNVRVAGRYGLDASPSKGGTTLAQGGEFFSLTPGARKLELRVPGLKLAVRSPATHDERDRLRLGGRTSASGRTAAYRHADFEPSGWAAIRLIGVVSDRGVDADGNGLFEELRVVVEVELARTDTYEWQATLKDAHHTVIDWDYRRGTLDAGKATIEVAFDGKKVRQNGVDGPYSVGPVGMFGITGPNVAVASFAKTRAYAVSSFER